MVCICSLHCPVQVRQQLWARSKARYNLIGGGASAQQLRARWATLDWPGPLLTDAAHMQTLDLAGNNFRGAIPRNLGGPRRLRFLHLGFNQLSGARAGPCTVWGMRRFKELQESRRGRGS